MNKPKKNPTWSQLFLRVVGTVSFSAIIFIYVPYSWMNQVHAWLGMGNLPTEPIVGYLARSTSAFYAIMGGLMWVCSFDIERSRPILFFLGYVFIVFGISIFVIDFFEGLPSYWIAIEGPADALFGIAILCFVKLSKQRNE
jgi:hypothetical protein